MHALNVNWQKITHYILCAVSIYIALKSPVAKQMFSWLVFTVSELDHEAGECIICLEDMCVGKIVMSL